MFPEPVFERESPRVPKQLLWTLSTQGIVNTLSSAASEITGWSEADCLGKPFHSFIHPEDTLRVEQCLPSLLRGETGVLGGFRCLARNGFYRTVSLSLVPSVQLGVVNELLVLGRLSSCETAASEGSLDNVFALGGREINPSHKALETAGVAKLLESLLANAPVGFALLDSELRLVCVNQTFSAMTGFSPEQQLRMSLAELLPLSAAVLEPMLRDVLSSGKSVPEFEVVLQKTPLVELSRYAQISFYPIPEEDGRICGVAAIALDITDRKRADIRLKKTSDELTRSNEALEVFCHTVSHDLNEPLRTIATYVTLLERKYRGVTDGEAGDYIQYAVRGTQHMRYMINGLLDYARAGHCELKPARVDCNEVVQSIVGDLKAIIEESGALVTCDALPLVLGDRLCLLQVLQNLIANAIKFRGTGICRVHVSAEPKGTSFTFSVADNGIGIKELYLPMVFRPFKKLHSQDEYPGAGLGLAISQKNIERLGGRIWVTSEVGKGSTFWFTLPGAEERSTNASG